MTLLRPISQKQFHARISDISDVFWMTVRGGQIDREKIKYNDGQKGIIQQFAGFIEIADLTLSKSFDPVQDSKVIQWCRKQIDTPTAFEVSLTPILSDLTGSQVPGSSEIKYSNCQLVGYKMPEADRNSSGLAMIEVTVICNELVSYM
jgi:hypothetical protein